LKKQARYLLSIACLVKDADEHDEFAAEGAGAFSKS
jgi:hypothetical protein